jgi:D-alanyl-D-alanine dipeptidase/L,D-peptidoglycan transpeptidase YkuD (ErfK/YbiS/YcfS/YnhG family)
MSRYLTLFFLLLCLLAPKNGYPQDISGHGQIIVSVTDSWDDFRATLYLFERKGEVWQRRGGGIPAVVGSLGLGWDPAAQERAPGEPVKREGDLKAPAGIFPLSHAMGFSPLPPDGVTLPYRSIGEGTHCVDDSSSPFYNRIVDESDISADGGKRWSSSERMWEMPELYRLLLVVGYNMENPGPGDGSCIFMHIRRPSGEPTYGCTAVAEEDLAAIMKWLKPGDKPALLQLARDAYSRLWRQWRLPPPELVGEDAEKKRIPLVDVRSLSPGIRVEMRYAGIDNFTGKRIYECGRCFLKPGTAAKLVHAQRALGKLGLSLKMWDCYRPLSAQRLFWSLVPDPRYVADPKTGSRHNRGNAVDVTLVDAKGGELEMPTGFDDFSPRAAHGETRLPARVIENRRLLAETMEKAGFKRLESEWWHYDDSEGSGAILDVTFEDLCR